VFSEAGAFNANISNWDTGKVAYMSTSTSTSARSTLFDHGEIMTDFFVVDCFVHCFTGYIVFYSARAFNADISKWDTGEVTNMNQSTSIFVPTFFVSGWDPLIVFFYFIFFCHPSFRVHCFLRSGGG